MAARIIRKKTKGRKPKEENQWMETRREYAAPGLLDKRMAVFIV
jgi:hypothetical protein